MKRLAGKTMLITGASSGFGRAIALAAAEEGADVALVARSEEKLNEVAALVEAQGRRAVVCVADVADEAQSLAAIDQATQRLGRIDVLVNNAGTNVLQRSIADTSSEQWRHLIDVNLTSAFLFTKAILPTMIERKDGLIINVASLSVLKPSHLGGVGYSAAKMGMDALNQITNQEGNRHGVRACLLCPGTANTPLLDRRPVQLTPEQRQAVLQPEDVAAVVVLVAALPQRANIDFATIVPTFST